VGRVERLGSFLTLRPLRKKRGTAGRLGNGLSLTHTNSQPRGARQRGSNLFSFADDVGRLPDAAIKFFSGHSEPVDKRAVASN
jgi:hypothetical protein